MGAGNLSRGDAGLSQPAPVEGSSGVCSSPVCLHVVLIEEDGAIGMDTSLN